MEQVTKQKSHEQLDKAAATLEMRSPEYRSLHAKNDKISYLLKTLGK
jgi:hypothetical protein